MTEKELQKRLENLSWNVYAMRRNMGMSIRDLSERSGVAGATISRMELDGNVAPRTSSLILVADTFGMTVDQLLTERIKLHLPLRPTGGRTPRREVTK